ncbi:MAG: thioredoxin domain-containing protein [Cyclobacteriaceae bacterium]
MNENRLANESSPYLLQHAQNPVDWYAWSEEALSKALSEDKPIIVSVGYSACHWCHVMERESFENDDIAAIMNEYFVCIKVDREERPDVDQIYMDAVQTMGLQGGWPLNVFLTPDQKPFYGGTYFPPAQWASICRQVGTAYREHKDQILESAENFARELNYSEVAKLNLNTEQRDIASGDLHHMFMVLQSRMDMDKGGINKAPKFPMPCIWQFLAHYYAWAGNEEALAGLTKTLDAMAAGGIYDQVGGGFARYSVDEEWFAPHFEKMLYDNGQLVSLYAHGYQMTGKETYRRVVHETIEWLEREMVSPEGGFYSALDADSEGEEGLFYIWQEDELNEVLGSDADLAKKLYNVHPEGNWEKGRNILFRHPDESSLLNTSGLTAEELAAKRSAINDALLKARSGRIRPGTDDKILTGWNGLMLTGLTDAYEVFGEERFLRLAKSNAAFIIDNMLEGSRLYRSFKEGKRKLYAYLEDYATTIQAFTKMYEVTFDEKYLKLADDLAAYTLTNFFDKEEGLFFFTDKASEELIARKKEIFDNVIPASNSIMATNLYRLGLLLENSDYLSISADMLKRTGKMVRQESQYMANWAVLAVLTAYPTAEIVVSGPEAEKFRQQLGAHFIPNKIIAGTNKSSGLPLLEGRTDLDKTTVFVCYNRACQQPVHTVDEALGLLRESRK